MIKRLRWPVRVNAAGTAFETVEQGTSAEILGAAQNVLKTVRGTRVTNPDFGVEETMFELGGAETDPLIDAIDEWEPRAKVAVEASEVEGMITRVRTELSA